MFQNSILSIPKWGVQAAVRGHGPLAAHCDGTDFHKDISGCY